MRHRLNIVAFLSLVVAQLGGCSSCMREEEPEPVKTFEPKGKQPSLSGKHRFQLYADASAED